MPRRKPAPTPPPIRVYVEPRYDYTQDHGEGGIKQVIRHVMPYLEELGVSFVDNRDAADVIWYHASPYTETKTWLNERPQVPVVASCHGLYWAGYDWDRASLAANADVIEGLRLADVVTAPSEWVKNAIDRGILADVRTVYHGIDMSEWEPVDGEPDVPYALWDKSRVDPVCDPLPVIDLAQLMPDQRFVMCAGPEGMNLSNVAILGRIPYDKARELTRNAAVYLCVTRETFGLATLQAMAASVPVVGWRYGGQAEIIRGPEDGGILVEPGDIGALIEAVKQARAERAALGDAARKRAAEFTWQDAARQYRQAFDDAIAAHAPPIRATVITTAYNAEKTIARTVASVLAAMGPDDEYIIVDDASTDKTHEKILLAIMGRNDKGTIRIINRAENGYLAQARNDALRVARGRYVTCLDADDELMPDALDVLAGELDKDRSTAIAYGKLYFMGDYPAPDGQGIESRPEEYGFGPGRSQWPFPFDASVQLEAQNVTCIPYSAMTRTAWLKRAGGWRTRCRTGEDLDLWMRLVSFGARPRMVTDADMLIYHTSATSMSVTNKLPDWGKWYPWTGAAGILSMPPWGIAAPPRKGEWAWPVGHNADPVVSVVIPVSDAHERYVLDAIDSVMAQTYRRWECIVVNDTGHTLGVRLPSWVKLVEESTGNRVGPAAARNAGLRAASSRYTVFLDADDWLDRSALDYLVAALEPHPELAVAYPDYWERRGDGGQWSYKPHMLPDWDCDAAQEAPGSLYGITAIYRTDALRAVGGFDVDCPGHEDADLQMALTYAGYCAARIPRRLYVYNLETGERRNESKRDEAAVVDWMRNKYAGRPKVACGTCGGRASVVEPIAAAVTQEIVLTGAMTEVQYNGAKMGGFSIRGGATGMTYTFTKGDIRPVMNEDLGFFESMPEYTVLRGAQRQPDGAMPELTVDGPPSGRRANVA